LETTVQLDCGGGWEVKAASTSQYIFKEIYLGTPVNRVGKYSIFVELVIGKVNLKYWHSQIKKIERQNPA
jgi:hypothetical protein